MALASKLCDLRTDGSQSGRVSESIASFRGHDMNDLSIIEIDAMRAPNPQLLVLVTANVMLARNGAVHKSIDFILAARS